MPRNKELEIAYRILGGIPDEQVNLNSVISKPGRTVKGKPFCGTIACGLGWLCMHPRYIKRGFGVRYKNKLVVDFKTPSHPNWEDMMDFVMVAREMFGIPSHGALLIFGPTTRDDKPHKAILLERIKNYLES